MPEWLLPLLLGIDIGLFVACLFEALDLHVDWADWDYKRGNHG